MKLCKQSRRDSFFKLLMSTTTTEHGIITQNEDGSITFTVEKPLTQRRGCQPKENGCQTVQPHEPLQDRVTISDCPDCYESEPLQNSQRGSDAVEVSAEAEPRAHSNFFDPFREACNNRLDQLLLLKQNLENEKSSEISDDEPKVNIIPETKEDNKRAHFLDKMQAMGNAMEQIKKENPAPLNNFYYIYSAILELQGDINVKISYSEKRYRTLAECQITLPHLTFNMEGSGDSPLESLVDLTEKLRPIVDKFADDKKSIDPCSIM